MRGRKINREFVNQFISQCISNNQITSQQILQEAQQQLSKIDIQINKINKLKLKRKDLLNIIELFEKPQNNSDQILLEFYSLNLEIAKNICFSFSNLDKDTTEKLLSIKVLSIKNEQLVAGKNYNLFQDFVNAQKPILS